MRLAAIALVALAGVAACYGDYPGGATRLGDAGPHPIGGGSSDAGDGGSDAGDAGPGGDAGPDAGCAPLTLNGFGAIDGCHSGQPTSATGTVNTVNCTIDITIPSFSGPCSGSVSGALDAFDGGCQSNFYLCTSPSLPGTLDCVYAGTHCQVRICDGGTCL